MKNVAVICCVILLAINCIGARWLPTRSQEDRLDKLKEMLKELLESEIEKTNYEGKYLYKRDVRTQIEGYEPAEEHQRNLTLQKTKSQD